MNKVRKKEYQNMCFTFANLLALFSLFNKVDTLPVVAVGLIIMVFCVFVQFMFR